MTEAEIVVNRKMNHSPAVPVIPGRCERDRNTDVRQMQATQSLLDTSND